MLRYRTRKEAEEAGVLRERPQAREPASRPGRLDSDVPLRQPGRRTETKPGAADTPAPGTALRESRGNRRPGGRRRKKLGEQVRPANEPFSLDLSPTEVQPMDPRLVVGESAGAGSRRTLLECVTLPLPPSVNNYWESQVVWSDKAQRHMSLRYVGTEGKKYQKLLRELLLERKAWYRSPHPLLLRVLVCPKSNNKQDISNRIKVLEDCFKTGFLYEDDSQIETLEVRRGPMVAGGCVIVVVREILPDRQGNLAWIRNAP